MAMPLGFGDRMQLDEAASDQSSSSLSPPPTSPHHADTIQVAQHPPVAYPRVSGGGVGNVPAATSAPATNGAAHIHHATATAHAHAHADAAAAPEKPKRQRKKKEIGPDGLPVEAAGPKKPRKPREPKVKVEGSTAPAPRKKQKIEEKAGEATVTVPPRQTTLTAIVNGYQQQVQYAATAALPPPSQHRSSLGVPPANLPPTPRPISSGQNYDPIRGYDPVRAATQETARQRPSHLIHSAPPSQPSPHVNRASASPSI
ncbi:HIR complex subunit, partial [Teratosphaeriaceae sp. CCFEE 6253]